MNLKRLTLFLCSAVLIACAANLNTAQAYPKPGLIHKSWVFNYSSDKPRFILVKDRQGKAHWYCYITYKVINNTDEERMLIPEFTLASDKGDIFLSGKNVPYRVYAAIQKRVNNRLMISPVQVIGKILRGPDFAQESVAIWPMPKHDIDEINVFISGLSGETKAIKHPLTRKPVIMSRTLMQTFKIPGTVTNYAKQKVVELPSRWIMR